MSDGSAIEWTQATWNPVTGCTKVSPGCDNCYAGTFAERWRGIPRHPYEQGFDLRLWPDRIRTPHTWRRPRMIFVNSMSDLFHPGVPDDFVVEVLDTIRTTPRHTYQILSKRPGRMASFLRRNQPDPLPNLWVGTSIESNTFVWRADTLRETPAIIRFLSMEPLLGPVPDLSLDDIDWLIVGGESGPRHRPIEIDWVRDLRDQCNDAKVPFFFKQWGGRTSKAGGRTLDDRIHDAMPAVV